jgi:nicotinamidase-related amidase
MQTALLLIDLQKDYLDSSGLEPGAGRVCAAAARLADACRQAQIPVVHVWTTIPSDAERRKVISPFDRPRTT